MLHPAGEEPSPPGPFGTSRLVLSAEDLIGPTPANASPNAGRKPFWQAKRWVLLCGADASPSGGLRAAHARRPHRQPDDGSQSGAVLVPHRPSQTAPHAEEDRVSDPDWLARCSLPARERLTDRPPQREPDQ